MLKLVRLADRIAKTWAEYFDLRMRVTSAPKPN